MQNMKSITNNDNMKVLNSTGGIKKGWNCGNKNNFP